MIKNAENKISQRVMSLFLELSPINKKQTNKKSKQKEILIK